MPLSCFLLTRCAPNFFSYTVTLLCRYLAFRLPCCAQFFFVRSYSVPCRAYPAMPEIFSCAVLLFHKFFVRIPAVPLFSLLLCAYFILAYPAVPLFFCALTLLRPYFFWRTLAVLTPLCSYFSSHLPCCALVFLRAYPAVPLSRFTITTYPCALIFLRTYPTGMRRAYVTGGIGL